MYIYYTLEDNYGFVFAQVMLPTSNCSLLIFAKSSPFSTIPWASATCTSDAHTADHRAIPPHTATIRPHREGITR